MESDIDQRIEHVVVLMLENHSFDHLLGFLEHPGGSEYNGLSAGGRYNRDSEDNPIEATPDGVPTNVDPDHTHQGALEQMAGYKDVPTNGGFVRNYERKAGFEDRAKVMQCLDPKVHSPALSTLALEFAVCTNWFCSVPGATWPNRNFAHAATSDSAVDIEFGFFRDPTIFEVIERAGASWRVYYDGTPQLWCFPKLWKPRLIVDFLLKREGPRIGNWFEFPWFVEHVRSEELATYTFIEPAHNTFNSDGEHLRQTNSQHPHNNQKGSSADFVAGEELISGIYESLRSRPALFAKTLLVIVYDEHGGFFDHEPPPGSEPPGDLTHVSIIRRGSRIWRAWRAWRAGYGRASRFTFSNLGFRVPAVLVSPWIREHTIVDLQLEHASIPATIRALFAPDSPNLTTRDQRANTFHQVLDSSLLHPRPNPDTDGIANGTSAATSSGASNSVRPLPVLPLRPRTRGTDVTPVKPSPTAESGELDHELNSLADRVRRTLRRDLASILLRSRAPTPPQPRDRGPAKPPDLFARTAQGARVG